MQPLSFKQLTSGLKFRLINSIHTDFHGGAALPPCFFHFSFPTVLYVSDATSTVDLIFYLQFCQFFCFGTKFELDLIVTMRMGPTGFDRSSDCVCKHAGSWSASLKH